MSASDPPASVGNERYIYDNDNDSALGSEVGSDTQTINSFITRYTWQHGRRYHADHVFNSTYWKGPNDEPANEQHHLTHHLYQLMLENKLHLAPINNPHNILDLGTGTGAWVVEAADMYPGAHVIGTDLSPIQPPFVPSNCHFEISDATMEWGWPANNFDFIHIRELYGSISDWDHLFNQCYKATKPGGWVEIAEHSVLPVSDDGTVTPDCILSQWGKRILEIGEKSGSTFSIWDESKERLQRAGFVDVVEKRYRWPLSGWSDDKRLKELGMWNQLRVYNGLEDFALRLLTTHGGYTYEQTQQYMADMRNALTDMRYHAYVNVSVVYGRKPGGNKS